MIFNRINKKFIFAIISLFLISGFGTNSFSQGNTRPNYEVDIVPPTRDIVGPNGKTYTGSTARYNCYADCRGAGLEIAFCMRACGLGMIEEP